MTKTAVPDEVRRFILTSVPSVPFLEALLLLRSQPAHEWDCSAVARRLYIREGHAMELLEAMLECGAATRTENGTFMFMPQSPELERLVDELAATYSQNLVGVTDLIHSRGDQRARQFADAFRWKKGGR